jgi:hypothetical protein
MSRFFATKLAFCFGVVLSIGISGTAIAQDRPMTPREQAEADRMERDFNMPNARCQEMTSGDRTYMVCWTENFKVPKLVAE